MVLRRRPFYVSDLDGTLLNDDAQVSTESRRILTALLADGLPFTVASARSVVSMRPLLAGLPLRLPVVNLNGAYISDLATGAHRVMNTIEAAVAEELFARVATAGHLPFVSTFDGARDRVYYADAGNEWAAWYVRDRVAAQDERLQRVDDLAATLAEHVVSLTVIDRWERIDDLAASIAETFAEQVVLDIYENRYSRGWHWVTVHDRRATKDQALQVLREQEGLTQHELVVFGDWTNDLGMFRLADRALATENALDEVKAAATAVIGPNTADSVARTIRDDWLGTSDP